MCKERKGGERLQPLHSLVTTLWGSAGEGGTAGRSPHTALAKPTWRGSQPTVSPGSGDLTGPPQAPALTPYIHTHTQTDTHTYTSLRIKLLKLRK